MSGENREIESLPDGGEDGVDHRGGTTLSPPGDETTLSRAGRSWLIASIVLSLAFLVPVLMMFRAAAEPGGRAADAVRHGFIQLDNEEGALLFQAMQMQRGDSIYHELTEPPYVAGTYTPVYMAMVAAADNFANPSFATGRLIVWISALGAAMLLVLLVLVTTRNPGLGVLAGFLFLATWEVYRWIGYFRVDFPAILFSMGGLTAIVFGSRRWWNLAVGALLMTLALFTKQTMIAAPAACVVALFFARPRDAAKFIGWMLLWGVPTVIALQLATGGQFLRHTILYNMNTSSWFNLQVWAGHVAFMHRWLILGVAVLLPFFIAGLVWASRRDWVARGVEDSGSLTPDATPLLMKFWQPLAWYALFAQWNFFAIAKAGSAENYLLEPMIGWALVVTLAAGAGLRAMAHSDKRWLKFVGVFIAVVALAATGARAKRMQNPMEYQIRFEPMRRAAVADFQAAGRLMALAHEADNPFFELAIFNLRTGHDPALQPFIMSELARQGRWDQGEFVESVREGKFDLVVTQEDVTAGRASGNYTKEMLAAFRRSYEVQEVLRTPLWTYYVLMPRADAGQVRAEEIARVG